MSEKDQPQIVRDFIIKVQLSLSTSHKQRQCLIYNKDRSLLQELPATDEVVAAMEGHDKRYFEASFNQGVVELNKPTNNQDW